MKKKFDIYESITDQIIEDIESNDELPWHLPWKQNLLRLSARSNGELYKGINQLLTLAVSIKYGFISNMFMTYNQAKNLGGNVRPKERGARVIYFKSVEITPDSKEEADGEDIETKTVPFIRYYHVYNVDQIEGLPTKYYEAPASINIDKANSEADRYLNSLGIDIKYDRNRAFYASGDDYIAMPAFSAFESASKFTSTLAHEIVHWTGHESRLNRKYGAKGTKKYAYEELVAELGSLFLCTRLGIKAIKREDHSAYRGRS